MGRGKQRNGNSTYAKEIEEYQYEWRRVEEEYESNAEVEMGRIVKKTVQIAFC